MAVNGRPTLAGMKARDEGTYVLDEQVGFLMRVAAQRHAALFASRMIEGLTAPQFAILAKLLEIGPCSQNRLGRLVALDAATIRSVVDRLTGRGFLMIANDPLDKRHRAVALSENGHAVAEAAVMVAREITESTLAPLTPDERLQAVALLKKLG